MSHDYQTRYRAENPRKALYYVCRGHYGGLLAFRHLSTYLPVFQVSKGLVRAEMNTFCILGYWILEWY